MRLRQSVTPSLLMAKTMFVRGMWLRPLLAIVLLSWAGWFVWRSLDQVLKADLESRLRTILAADVTALKLWMRGVQESAKSEADDPDAVKLIERLVAISAETNGEQLPLLQAPEQSALRNQLQPFLDAHHYDGFGVIDRSGRFVASRRNDAVGMAATDAMELPLKRVFEGQTAIILPFKSPIMLPDLNGQLRAGVPTMFSVAPVRNQAGEIIAGLAIRIHPQREFSEILKVARAGETGETYAFDRSGLMLSLSRFDSQLKQIGLLPDDAESVLMLQLRNPGVDMTQGQRPRLPRSEQPLTVPVASAVRGEDGVNLEGYRDYRGVWSYAAWTWLDEFNIGIVTEVDLAEAYRSQTILLRVFGWLFVCLALLAAGIAIYSVVVARMKQKSRLAELEIKRLGQYTLAEKLGEGGMGVVYRAHHAMLHRPTAVKFLNPERAAGDSAARFEREVQLTSQLCHPNTIAIYDYGRTDEGVFYYAMEYLDGIDLQNLVKRYGPLPDGRVIPILQQVCGSLAEAHAAGLIHRDIKPANIVLNARGGLLDFVKVLDFGLARAVDHAREAHLTNPRGIIGTPLY
ncbi:MAG: serine/threonine protein kinase, partial [Planctomycetaceae bacterium]|nr:serine/threonine protein kinase [Planctomycetaceae bacterium]